MEGLARAAVRPGMDYGAARASVTVMYRAGVPILAGTDAHDTGAGGDGRLGIRHAPDDGDRSEDPGEGSFRPGGMREEDGRGIEATRTVERSPPASTIAPASIAARTIGGIARGRRSRSSARYRLRAMPGRRPEVPAPPRRGPRPTGPGPRRHRRVSQRHRSGRSRRKPPRSTHERCSPSAHHRGRWRGRNPRARPRRGFPATQGGQHSSSVLDAAGEQPLVQVGLDQAAAGFRPALEDGDQPAGNPASFRLCSSFAPQRAASSDAFQTTAFPAASAWAIGGALRNSG